MLLNEFDQQMAMDYIVYMMVGSYFKKTVFAQPAREKIMHLRYIFLGSKKQIELEEAAERFFLQKVRDSLPEDFLEAEVTVSWKYDGKTGRSAVVFSDKNRSLHISTRYGGKFHRPVFRARTEGLEGNPSVPGTGECRKETEILVYRKAG